MFPTTMVLSVVSLLVLLPSALVQDTPDTEPDEMEFTPSPDDCREEQYPCTRLYSIHHPRKQCVHTMCFYSLRRMYVVNKEICLRTVCLEEERIKADLCRTMQGWPARVRRNSRGRSHVQCNQLPS